METIGLAAAWLATLIGWRRALAAALAGAVCAAAFAPYFFLPALAVGFTVLVWLLDGAERPRVAAVVSFLFAYGYGVTGLWWMREAFFVDADRFGLLWPLAVFGVPLLLAPYFAITGALARRYLWLPGFGRLVALTLAWSLAEFLRSTMLTGLPWNLAGYVWAISDSTIQAAAITGADGLTVLTVLLAMVPALLIGATRRDLAWAAGIVVLMVGLFSWGAWRLTTTPTDLQPGQWVRLVQPSIDQGAKWQPEQRRAVAQRLLDLSVAPGADKATLVIWPETATPFLVADEPRLRQLIGLGLRPDGIALIGTVRASPRGQGPDQIWNSMIALDHGGDVLAIYDKAHLVPFGEFMPLRGLFSLIKLDQLAVGAIDFSFGDSPRTIALPGLPPIRPLICYEAIFPREVATAEPRAGLLVNITNDAWFGSSAGPHQHFAMARFRAVEQGLPMLRAANTGISAIVDPLGRVIAELGLNQIGVVDGPLPVATKNSTIYSRTGDLFFWSLIVLSGILLLFFKRN